MNMENNNFFDIVSKSNTTYEEFVECQNEWMNIHENDDNIDNYVNSDFAVYVKSTEKPVNDTLFKISSYLNSYSKLHKNELINISPVFETSNFINVVKGCFTISNGKKGAFKFTRQSLFHVYEIMKYIEDHYNSEVFIKSFSHNENRFNYVIGFEISIDENNINNNNSKLNW